MAGERARNLSLSPAGARVQSALLEANTIVAYSRVGEYLEAKQSPEGHATLVAAVMRELLIEQGIDQGSRTGKDS